MKKFHHTHIDRNGMRTLTGPNQGRLFSNSKEEAETKLALFLKVNSESLIADVYGEQAVGTFEVRELKCYENGDSRGIYFREDIKIQILKNCGTLKSGDIIEGNAISQTKKNLIIEDNNETIFIIEPKYYSIIK